ncbi:MAG: T9SS type A sorting domain-containing protein [Bacteroidales bacterium]|nr:T9SS type A sorting domain-containing protein [Bacteroidales bacterium]
MKILNISIVTLLFLALLSPVKNVVGQAYTRDSLTMGQGYANDLFYSFANGLVKEEPRSNWDIAFYTPKFSAGIMINQGAGVSLYTYPKGDTNAWATVDTNGFSTWKSMNNSVNNWEDGAFNENQLSEYDYGWGIYNMVTHNLTGDSLYVIKIADGSIKKLWMMDKFSIQNIYHFKYANIDGSDEKMVEFNLVPYETKNFAYYSLVNNAELDREPLSGAWDLLFTKYMDSVPDMEGNMQLYLITGAANNVGIGASHFYPVGPNFTLWGLKPFVAEKNVIAAGWKEFDNTTFSYQMVDSTYYFVKDTADNVFKLKFVYFDFMTGSLALDKMLVSISDINDNMADRKSMSIYPVPATDNITIRLNTKVTDDSQLAIYDLNGRNVYSQSISGTSLTNGASVNVNLPAGLYIAKVTVGQAVYSQKLLLR